ncbi:MAG: TRAP transporter large permease subunit [Treponema sp.]|nr:TRAP transporter large permease subunit [Treponema sp.]
MFEIRWFVLALSILMYALVIIKQDKKVWFTSAAALILVVLSLFMPGKIFNPGDGSQVARSYSITHPLFTLINWNVLMIYVGSMIIAALFIYSKVPARIADFIVEKSKSTGIAIILILAMTGIISIFVENVATVLVMAPIALALSKKLNMNPSHFMIGLAVMSNLEGTATLVGDPPSMIFASYAGYTFNDFFISQGRISIFFFIQAGLLVGCLFFYSIFRKQKEKAVVERTEIISTVPFILLISMIAGLAAISFIHTDFEYLSGLYVFALGLIGLCWYVFSQKKTKEELWTLIKELDWETIFFLCGIFIVVGAISETGLLSDFAGFLAKVTKGSKIAGFVLILLVSIILSGFIDNVPYIIVMLPVSSALALSVGTSAELYMFALLIGSCLGGNLTPFGASANVVAMGIVKKEGYPMSFGKWLKVCIPFTLLTTGTAALLLWLVWA